MCGGLRLDGLFHLGYPEKPANWKAFLISLYQGTEVCQEGIAR